MEGDENLGSFTAPDSSGSSGGNIFIPTAIGLVGILLGGIALYLAFSGSGKSTETQAALKSATEQTAALEDRLAGIEEQLAKLSTEMSSQDTRLRTLAGQTQTALSQVGVEMNKTRQQSAEIAEKVQEIIAKMSVASAPPQPAAPTNVATITAAGNAPTNAPDGSAAPAHREHTIASGETFAKLSNKYNVSVDAILAANPDADPRRLQVGQKIKIPHNDHERE